jgi:hypothetical protein
VSAARLEALLAELYTDEAVRDAFIADPRGVAGRAGLDDAEVEAMAAIDRVGLELAARSFAHKRAGRAPRGHARRRARLRFLTAAAAWRYLVDRWRGVLDRRRPTEVNP